MKTVLSGIQPSGKIHLGNYLGATRQHVAMQKDFQCIYLIADLHALTTVRDAEKMRNSTMDLAADYLALGIDPQKTIFFKQSDVPQHAELAWIFDCITPMGLLERAHAWKDAGAKGIKDPTVGLFNYPVLMAVDILLYKPNLVPVGKDQKQHIEIARDIAVKFNEHFGETFPLPEDYIKEEVAVVPGTDGQKMSKSYGNTIDIFADEEVLKKQVMGIMTDSTPVEAAKDPEKCIPYLLYRHLASPAETEEMAEKLKKGGVGYGDIKKTLLAKILEYFAEAREKRAQLIKKPNDILDILADGAKRARVIAEATMEEVRKKTGLR
jgi:tryptophanyl-tRNA synthetase